MAGTFAMLMLAGLGTLIQIGFALAFGVLLDTFLVRPFLVPALTVLVWRRGEAREAEEELVILSLRRRKDFRPRRVA
jgi:RND superfamily putative drug exporter